jgi:hypothetical protein
MKIFKINLAAFCITCAVLSCGCQQTHNPAGVVVITSSFTGFEAVKLEILGLTEVSCSKSGECLLKAYISAVDGFGSRIKISGVFRSELYKYDSRAADNKGRRLLIWSDTDLTTASENNSYWKDFLRAYEFRHSVNSGEAEKYVLEVTCTDHNGRRLIAQSVIYKR